MTRVLVLIVPAAAGMSLVLPSIWSGLVYDDYILWATISGASALRDIFPPRLNLWAFIDGDPERTRQMMNLGVLPWWMCECANLHFWRPLASVTHWLDFTRWPQQPLVMHVHNVVWFGLLIVTATVAYRQVMGGAAAAILPALLYSLDGRNAGVVAWISSRNTLLAALFGCLCLWAHDRWRRSGWSAGRFVSPAFLGLGVMASESAVATAAYLVAHAVCLDRDTWRRRLLVAMSPCAVVLVAWQAMYHGLGYGVFAVSPIFVNPLHEPALFLRRIVEHGPIYLLAQWTGWFPAADYAGLAGAAALTRWLIAIAVVAVVAVALAPFVRSDPVSRFFALGQVLALVPIAGASPTDRYTMFVGFGVMGLIGRFVYQTFDRRSVLAAVSPGRAPMMGAACVLAILHLVVAPSRLAREAATFPGDSGAVLRTVDQLTPRPEARRMVIVNPPDATFVIPALLMRAMKGERILPQTLALTYSHAPVRISRTTSQTIVVTPTGQQHFMFWPRGLRVEQAIRLAASTIRITALDRHGRPAEFAVTFDAPLEDPSFQWMRWTRTSGYTEFTPPAIGTTVEVAG